MNFVEIRKYSAAVAAIIALGQLTGMVFCGDTDCLQGHSEESCAAPMCGWLAKHVAPATDSDGDSPDSCNCCCHTLIDVPEITLQPVLLQIALFRFADAMNLCSAPIHDIDHPPLA